jgi:phosphoglycolate phosphatase
MRAIEAHLGGKTRIIWDWNGTLLNDLELSVSSIGQVLRENGLPEISTDRHRETFGFPVREYYQRIGFDLGRLSFEELSRSFIERYSSRVLECDLYPGARELLSALQGRGVRQAVLSAAEEGHLRLQLGHCGILGYFDEVFGLSDTHAASKIERGQELIGRLDCPRGEILLIGDTDHDLEVARELDVDALLLGDGHQAYERLIARHSRVLRSRSL